MLRMINEDSVFLLRVLFSDETNFCNNERVQHTLLDSGESLLDANYSFSTPLVSKCPVWHRGQSYYQTTFF